MRPAATALALLAAFPAVALPVAGRDVPDGAHVGGRTLRLNGAGVRVKLFFHVYLCALYLEEPSSDPAAILAANGAWKVSMHFLRDVDHHRILEAFTEAFEHNSPGQLPALAADLERFHAILPDLRRDDDLEVSYQPGLGTTLVAPGGARVTVPGKPFADALLRTWIGEHPSDHALRERLLGRAPPG
jgi:hypothetical protein